MNNDSLDDAMLTVIRQYQILEYVRVAIVTLFFYDYFVSFKREVASIWTGKWTTLNVLYILARYTPFLNFIDLLLILFLDHEGSKFCLPLFQLSMWTSTLGLVMSEACFCLRAYALWGTSRRVAIFLIGLFSAMVVTGFVVNGFVSASAKMMEPTIAAPGLIPRCIVQFDGATVAICGWIIVMAVDTTLISMIIYAKTRMYYSFNVTSNELLNQIYRDAVYYFFYNFLISLSAVIFYFISPGPVKSASSTIGTTLFSILSCRVMLRLRDFGNSHLLDQDITSLSSSMALSSLRFNRGRTDNHMSHAEECP